QAFGMKTYTCKSVQELKDALEDSKKQTVACLFDLKIIPKTMTDGYGAWWDVGMSMAAIKESAQEAAKDVIEHRAEARKY
ncbi:MAG: 3D-(3,5/4)-trihydroxycyclohexane-1,2-dione acylhydrolase (decyclizing), partial [Lachnospiraceae bacterium]|nr:3D-(3,5/4)-trihydroxycyclohexane-1,2-dione acylhydrolase (decyclizing) [Lachnospiraceae bacterium]